MLSVLAVSLLIHELSSDCRHGQCSSLRGKPARAQAAPLAYRALQREPALLPLSVAFRLRDISQAAIPQNKPCTFAGSFFDGQIIQRYVTADIFTPFALQDNLREGTFPSISSGHMCEVPLESTVHPRQQ